MRIEDLKVENASVRVSNAKADGAKYKISANFRTSESKLTHVESGSVVKEGAQVATFYVNMDLNNATSVTYYGDITRDVMAQCEVNALIYEFVELAMGKVQSEINE